MIRRKKPKKVLASSYPGLAFPKRQPHAEVRDSCETCGTTIQRAGVSGRHPRFCRACLAHRRYHPCPDCGKLCARTRCLQCDRNHVKLKTRPQRPCPECGTLFWPRILTKLRLSKFCGQRCRLEFERKRRWVTVACTNCGKPVVRDSGQIFRKIRKRLGAFCSKLCQAQHFTGANHPVWRGGSDPNRGHDWRKRAERIRERDGYACRWCGKTQEQAGQKLSVDHVRPWREFEDKAEANDESNLVALCRKCHSKKGGLERKWLKGDGLALQEYRRMVGVSIKTIGPVDL